MANLCYTAINVSGKPNECISLFNALNDALEDNNWLGNIVSYVEEDTNIVSCRGSVTDIDMNESQTEVTIFMETAWSPLVRPIQMLIEYLHLDESVNIEYTAEEESGWYVTNKDDIAGKYLVENLMDGNSYEYQQLTDTIKNWGIEIISEDDLRIAICEETGLSQNLKTHELIDELTRKYDDIYIHMYEYASWGELVSWN